MDRDMPQVGNIKLLFEEIEKAIPRLPKKYHVVAHKFFIELKPKKVIAKEEKLSTKTIACIQKRMLKLLEKSGVMGSQKRNMVLNYNALRVKAMLLKRADEINYAVDLYQYLSDEYKYVFENNMLENNEHGADINRKLGKSYNTFTSDTIKTIFSIIERQILRKKAIDDFYHEYGEVDNVDDMAEDLTEYQRAFLYEYILSMDPEACRKWRAKNGDTISSTKKQVLNKFDVFMYGKPKHRNIDEEYE